MVLRMLEELRKPPRRRKVPGFMKVYWELKKKMSLDHAYTAEAISEMIGKRLENTRRYLRILVELNFLVVEKDGKQKYYALWEAVHK